MGSHGAISRANFLSRPAATRSHYQDRGPGYCRLRHQSGHCHSSRAFCAGPSQVRKPRRCPPDTMQRHRSDPQERRALNSGYCPCRTVFAGGSRPSWHPNRLVVPLGEVPGSPLQWQMTATKLCTISSWNGLESNPILNFPRWRLQRWQQRRGWQQARGTGAATAGSVDAWEV